MRKIEEEGLLWDATRINLKDFHPTLKAFSPIKALTDLTFIAVDIGCGAFFLQEWKFLDLNYYANKIGKYRAFRWVPNQILDNWIRGGLCIGFALNVVKAVQSLRHQNLDDNTRVRAWWLIAVSVSEFIFNFSVLIRCKPCPIYFFTALAKGIGVLSVMFEPPPVYFPKYEYRT
jgi:hypothetical protein